MDLIHLLGVVLIQLLILHLLQLLQPFELGVQLVVPGVQHCGLEEEGAEAHNETRDGEVFSYKNHEKIILSFKLYEIGLACKDEKELMLITICKYHIIFSLLRLCTLSWMSLSTLAPIALTASSAFSSNS